MSNLYRGTTPTLSFKIENEDFDMTKIEICHITIQNKGGENKTVFDSPTIDTENKIISVELDQEDTLKYKEGKIELQIRIKLDTGRVVATPILVTEMNKILEETIL